MIRYLQLLLMTAFVSVDRLADRAVARFAQLRRDPERGGGRGSLEEVLMAVGGVIAAGAVVAAIAAAISSASGKVK